MLSKRSNVTAIIIISNIQGMLSVMKESRKVVFSERYNPLSKSTGPGALVEQKTGPIRTMRKMVRAQIAHICNTSWCNEGWKPDLGDSLSRILPRPVEALRRTYMPAFPRLC